VPGDVVAPLVGRPNVSPIRLVLRGTEALDLLVVYAGAIADGPGLHAPELRQLAVTHDLIGAILGAGRQLGIQHGPLSGKKAGHDDIVFPRSGPDADVTTNAQDTSAFSRHRSRIRQVVINLRHKHEIDATVRERKLVG
jgi:hypothetical protein